MERFFTEKYSEGTVLHLIGGEYNFDECLDIEAPIWQPIEEVRIVEDIETVEKLCVMDENCYVINCFEVIDSDFFSNKFFFNTKTTKPNDIVYAVIATADDLYSKFILGFFTEMPDKKLVEQKYFEENEEWINIEEIVPIRISY